MSRDALDLLSPYQPHPVVFETPMREPFKIYSFKTWIDAFKLLRQMSRDNSPRRAENYYNEALKAHSIGHFAEAESAYVRCLSLQPEHEPAHNNLAALYVQQNSADLAIEQLERAIRERPNYFRGYYNLGLIYQYLGEVDQAVDLFRKTLELKPTHFWSHASLGEIHAHREEFIDAIQHYLDALPHSSDNQAVYLRLADLYYHATDMENMEVSLRNALEIRPTAEIYFNLGWILAVQGDNVGESAEMFRLAEQLKNSFPEALLNLALTQSASSRFEQSVHNMKRYVNIHEGNELEKLVEHLGFLIEMNSRNHLAGLEVAEVYLAHGQAQKAIDYLKSILTQSPNYLPALEKLGLVYVQMGRHKDAINTYRKLLKIDANHLTAYLGLAKAYGAIENYAAALPVIRKVLDLDPKNADFHYQYATLMAQNNQLETAYKHYRMVQHLNPAFPRIEKRIRMLDEELEEQRDENSRPFKTHH